MKRKQIECESKSLEDVKNKRTISIRNEKINFDINLKLVQIRKINK